MNTSMKTIMDKVHLYATQECKAITADNETDKTECLKAAEKSWYKIQELIKEYARQYDEM